MSTSVLVTGANGQLGKEFRALAQSNPHIHFHFAGKEELDVVRLADAEAFFKNRSFGYCINCAAYTAVDQAENDALLAQAINTTAVGNLARACEENGIRFIHISTDYVFDGNSHIPYDEEASVAPLNVYGKTKLAGEQLVLRNAPDGIIIRTSWLYTRHGKNFVNTMRRLMEERETISVVADQFGSPTNGADLAMAVLTIIESGADKAGIYHFSNEGAITWYQFALAIKEFTGSECDIKAVDSSSYPTAANRPAYSVLNCKKIQDTFGISLRPWRESLKNCLKA